MYRPAVFPPHGDPARLSACAVPHPSVRKSDVAAGDASGSGRDAPAFAGASVPQQPDAPPDAGDTADVGDDPPLTPSQVRCENALITLGRYVVAILMILGSIACVVAMKISMAEAWLPDDRLPLFLIVGGATGPFFRLRSRRDMVAEWRELSAVGAEPRGLAFSKDGLLDPAIAAFTVAAVLLVLVESRVHYNRNAASSQAATLQSPTPPIA